MKIFVIGNIGSGKSTAAKMLAKKLNFKYINLDELGHQVIEEDHQLIADNFGEFKNREELAMLVFNKTAELNKITHPLIYKKMQEELTQNCIVEETVYDKEFISNADIVLCVNASFDVRKNRATNVNFERINAVQPQDLKTKADYAIENDSNFDKLEESVDEFITWLNLK